MEDRIKQLAERCVDTYTPEDILKHYMEESTEALMAVFRVTRDREPLINLIEEIVDSFIEAITVLTLLRAHGFGDIIDEMIDQKLAKFKAMLDKDERSEWEPLKERYYRIEKYIGERKK